MSITDYNEQINKLISRRGESWKSILLENEDSEEITNVKSFEESSTNKSRCSDIVSVNPLSFSCDNVRCNNCNRVVHILSANSHMISCKNNQILKSHNIIKENKRKEIDYIPDSSIESLINPFLCESKDKLEEPKKYESSYDCNNLVKYEIRSANSHSQQIYYLLKAESAINVELFLTKPESITSNGNNRISIQRRSQPIYRNVSPL